MSGLDSNVSNLCDVIDTKDILARLEELQGEYLDGEGEPITSAAQWSDEDWQEQATLSNLISVVRDDANDSPEDGVTLIRETYFADYIKEQYSDGMGPELHRYDDKTGRYSLFMWDDLMDMAPFSNIDWAAVADNASTDYSQIEYDGVTYYYM